MVDRPVSPSLSPRGDSQVNQHAWRLGHRGYQTIAIKARVERRLPNILRWTCSRHPRRLTATSCAGANPADLCETVFVSEGSKGTPQKPEFLLPARGPTVTAHLNEATPVVVEVSASATRYSALDAADEAYGLFGQPRKPGYATGVANRFD
ncbi:MAG: hypothetical protein R2748_02945 [Bryobacterales bacterium]